MITDTLKSIKAIKFGILSPDIIRKMSGIRIVTADTYDKDGYPIEAGLMDLHLGVIDPGLRCKTCGQSMARCPGHFGHIELVRPIVHVGYVKEIYALLKSTCRKCGRLLISKKDIEKYKEMMLSAEEEVVSDVLDRSKKASKCPHCEAKQENIRLEKPTSFMEGEKKINKRKILASEARERLEKIPDGDLVLLGFDPAVARPEWMILTVLPVPPVTVRPSITLETGERSEDDLTHKLVDILRINQRLRDNIAAGAPQLIIEDLWELLQYHVTTYISNEVSGIPPARHRSGRPLKTLSQRLKGKEGRFRYNLSGKRVNFSARTVVSPDPCLSINEVGVPVAIASVLTIPEKVTEFNVDQLKKIIANKDYPTANYIVRKDGMRKKVSDLNKEAIVEELEPGFVVERQLIDEDVVIFNRQPSLHRVSMMAHRVRILPGKTFRLNTSVCPPYNADFDGDEMNLHVPQTEEARMEALKLMSVQDQMISARHSRPLIVGEHDHVSGTYFLTKEGTVYTPQEASNLLKYFDFPNLSGKKEITGKELFSYLLPSTLSTTYKNALCRKCENCKMEKCEYEAHVVIKAGKLKCGAIEKKALAGPLLAKIFKDYGADFARKFLDNVTRLGLAVISSKGFTVGISDSDLPDEAKKEIEKAVKKAKDEVSSLINKFNSGNLEPIPGKTARETLEDMSIGILGKARDDAGKTASEFLERDNHSLLMAQIGARGNLLNLTQMTACVGQQAVRAKRITRGYKGRTLPHFEEGNIQPEACGFVESSFKKGLTPLEYFFHAMGGREGLVDKGIRTAKSGYMQRRLINALLDLYVNEDGTVRDSGSTIIQFKYGEDSLHPMKCIGGSFIDWSKYFKDEEQEATVIDRVEAIEFEEGESMEDLVDSIES